MSPVREMKDGRGKCIFYGSLPQETGGLTPMIGSDEGFFLTTQLLPVNDRVLT